jgi:hypothetical protein
MKKILYSVIFLSIVFFIGCEDEELDYVKCGWVRIEDGGLDDFYQVGNNGSPRDVINNGSVIIGDYVRECNWIHLYKDDDELEIEKENGSIQVISLSNKDYTYGKL